MRTQIILALAVVWFSVALTGCSGPPANSAGNANMANANANTNPLETKKPEPEKVTNNAPTLTPVFKAFCDAWAKNDEAALRKVYSKDTIKFFEDQMKLDKAKSLIKYLEPTDKVSGNPCEVTNEKIEGDRAVAYGYSRTYLKTGEEIGTWRLAYNRIDLERREGRWQMTRRTNLMVGSPGAQAIFREGLQALATW